MTKHTNSLIKETSPYLLQHAHNPVNWLPWNEETLNMAQAENKLLLISIGYSACHWCHVMEHECFEDEDVAQVMNDHFINIKVDREERPDVDQIYMSAVQLMTGRGGWPLNVIALPDGRPVWGATYVPKQQWTGVLNQLADLYQTSSQSLIDYAEKLSQGMKQVSLFPRSETDETMSFEELKDIVKTWQDRFDVEMGGTLGAPKFMMPNNLSFLLHHAHQTKDNAVMTYVINTIDKMSFGGLYDHVDGGFSRYSVDEKWHVPHFEKMLYDNAQLVSLYSQAYALTKNNWYKTVVYETLEFIKSELTRDDGSFYSALDADSLNASGELEEGAYYVWTKAELKELLNDDFELFQQYYNINDYGHWEHGNYVLIRAETTERVANANNISVEALQQKIATWKSTLSKERDKRPKPRLDDKSLVSWNAMMLKAYVDAYNVFKNVEFLEIALKNARFIENTMLQDDGRMWHTFNQGKAKINAYLDDYAHTIDAFLALYGTTMDKHWLELSTVMTNYVFKHFYDEEHGVFYYNSINDKALVTRPVEIQDNVIPASNSVMANNLFAMSKLTSNATCETIVRQQCLRITKDAMKYPGGYSNWLRILLFETTSFYEVVVVGEDSQKIVLELKSKYRPNAMIIGTNSPDDMELFVGRWKKDDTLIYVCQNKICQLPVKTVSEALSLMA